MPPAEDVETLRALAHPLRVRLLSALRGDGPATASELGRRLRESSGSTSYHLRQLARYGFVAEDETQPSRRERRWRALGEGTSWQSAAEVSDFGPRLTPTALRHLMRDIRTLVDRYAESCAGDPQAERVHLHVEAAPR